MDRLLELWNEPTTTERTTSVEMANEMLQFDSF
jgi:hypothetical protein